MGATRALPDRLGSEGAPVTPLRFCRRLASTATLVVVLGPAAAIDAQPQLSFHALPELPGAASEVHSVALLAPTLVRPNPTVAAGRALDGDGLWKAVAWWPEPGPSASWTIDPLPNPFGVTESEAAFFDIAVDFTDIFCSVGGSVDDLEGDPQPVVWTGDCTAGWTASVQPLPVPFDAGAILAMDKAQLVDLILKDRKAGWVQQSAGPEPRHAVLWDVDEFGLPTVELLPDTGPGFSSEARSIARDPVEESDPNDDLAVIGGSLQTAGSPEMPCVWEELALGGFARVDLPVNADAYTGGVNFVRLMEEEGIYFSAAGYTATPAGLTDLYRGVLYRRTGGVWQAPVVLPPLPGFRDSRASTLIEGTSTSATGITVVGHSYSEATTDSAARDTVWEILADDSVSTFDANDLASNTAPGLVLGPAPAPPGLPRLFKAAAERAFDAVISVGAVFTDTSVPASSGTPHAYVVSSAPVAVPTTSAWGMLALLLALLSIGTLRIRSQRSAARTDDG